MSCLPSEYVLTSLKSQFPGGRSLVPLTFEGNTVLVKF